MAHINTILTEATYEFLTCHLQGVEHRYGFEDMFTTVVIDTGQPYKRSDYIYVKDLLRQPTGHEYGLLSLHDVLRERLIAIAQDHSARPEKAIATFLDDLERRVLVEFLGVDDDCHLVQRERKLRRNLDKIDYRLAKSRTRNPLGANYRVYDIIHRTTLEINVDAPRHLSGLEKWVEERLGKMAMD